MVRNTNPTARILAVGALLLVAGCLGAVGTDETSDEQADELEADEITENLENHDEFVDDVQGVMTMEVETDGEVERSVLEFWERPVGEHRTEVIEASGPYESAGDTTVTDGETMWVYNSQDEEVLVFDIGTFGDGAMAGDHDEAYSLLFGDEEVAYVGTESVGDREAHVLEVNTKDAEFEQDRTVWVDTEYWYPLQEESVMTVDGEQTTIVLTYEDLTFNEGIDDERFRFDTPEGATVIEDPVPDIEEYDTVEEAATAVPFEVHEPTVPDGYDLESVTVSDSERETALSLSYESADGAFLSISASDSIPPHPPEGERIAVGDTEAILTTQLEMTTLHLECDGVYYTITEGGSLETDEVLAVAKSIPCE